MIAILEEENEPKILNQNLKRCKGYTDINGEYHECGVLFDNQGLRRKIRCLSCTNLNNLAKKSLKKWSASQPRVRCRGFTDSEGHHHSCVLMVRSQWISGRCGGCNAKQKITEIERKKRKQK